MVMSDLLEVLNILIFLDSGCFGYLELFRIILGCLNVLQIGDVFDYLDYFEHLGFF